MTKAMVVLLSMPIVSSNDFLAQISAYIPASLHSHVANVDKEQLIQSIETLQATMANMDPKGEDQQMAALMKDLERLNHQIK